MYDNTGPRQPPLKSATYGSGVSPNQQQIQAAQAMVRSAFGMPAPTIPISQFNSAMQYTAPPPPTPHPPQPSKQSLANDAVKARMDQIMASPAKQFDRWQLAQGYQDVGTGTDRMFVNPTTGAPARIDYAQKMGVADANALVDSKLANRRMGDDQRRWNRGPYSGGFGIAVPSEAIARVADPRGAAAADYAAQKERVANSAAAQGIAKREQEMNRGQDGKPMQNEYGMKLYRPDDPAFTDWYRKKHGLSAGDDVTFDKYQLPFQRHLYRKETNEKYRDFVEGRHERYVAIAKARKDYQDRRRKFRMGDMAPEEMMRFASGIVARQNPAMAAQMAMQQIAMGQQIAAQQTAEANRRRDQLMALVAGAGNAGEAARMLKQMAGLEPLINQIAGGGGNAANAMGDMVIPAAPNVPSNAPLKSRALDAHNRLAAQGINPTDPRYKSLMQQELGQLDPADLAQAQDEARNAEGWRGFGKNVTGMLGLAPSVSPMAGWIGSMFGYDPKSEKARLEEEANRFILGYGK